MTDAEQRALAILLAEKAMKWKPYESGMMDGAYITQLANGDVWLTRLMHGEVIREELWNPATNVAQAIECAVAMQERGWSVRLDFVPDRLRTAEMPERYVCLMMWRGRAVDGIADTIEVAICLAIKQALKQEAQCER